MAREFWLQLLRRDSPSTTDGPRLSAPAYFAWVCAVTVLWIVGAAMLRPTFATDLALWTGLKATPVAVPDSFYSERVQPLFEQSCNNCHGDLRQKGHLRLDSFSGLMRGGKSGPSVEEGNPDASELFRRLVLPPDDDQVMPPQGQEPLSDDEILVIRLWIEHGASGTLAVDAIKNAPEPKKEVIFPEFRPELVAEKRAPIASIKPEIQANLPGVVSFESRSSANVVVNASILGADFGDREMAMLAALSDHVVRLDASRTSVTDAAIGALPDTMPNLQVLILKDTAITDASVTRLASLSRLSVLTVTGSPVTADALEDLRVNGVIVYANDDLN